MLCNVQTYNSRIKMKSYVYAICLLFLTTACSVQATTTCTEPKLSKITSNNSIFHFHAEVTCKLVDVKVNLSALKDAYKAEITNPKSQFKVKNQKDYNDGKGMTGYEIDATQSYKTPHGPLSVTADILITDDKSSKFDFELKSKSIHGEGDASNNKSISNSVTLQIFPDHDELVVTKDIYVEEPWYAPDSMFIDTVEKELLASIKKAADDNARKISGENVEALRK